ncbi:MAG: enoyl-CoA hydratase/isomerase family protein [Desulfobacterales bacterium]
MPDFQTLAYEKKGNIGILQLNRPEILNAVNRKMLEELEIFLDKRHRDPDTRVLIIHGAGEKGFCSGVDIKENSPQGNEKGLTQLYNMQIRFSGLNLKMRKIPQPIIAAVHGFAVGAGFGFFLASDIRVVTEDVRLIAPFLKLGLSGVDEGCSYFLPRLIGAGRSSEFLFTGDPIDAKTAMELGLVSRVVSKEKLMDTAEELAEKIAKHDSVHLRLTKEAINTNLDAPGLEAALKIEDRNQVLCALNHITLGKM